MSIIFTILLSHFFFSDNVGVEPELYSFEDFEAVEAAVDNFYIHSFRSNSLVASLESQDSR